MSYLTTVRIYKGILIWSGVIILMTAVLDLKLQSTHSFWQDHSFTTNIACGILLLLLGFFGVEAWFREHEAHRWQQVANVSCKELGYSCDVLNNGVEHLLTGYFRSKHGVFLSDEIERNIERHLKKYNLYDPDQRALPSQERQHRLNVLLNDPEWVDYAQHILDYLKHLHRDKIAIWMPIMLTTDESIKALNSVAELNEFIFKLQHPLRELARLRSKHPDSLNIENLKQEVLQRWDEVITKSVKVQQDLMRLAGEASWLHPGRVRLSPHGLKQIEQ